MNGLLCSRTASQGALFCTWDLHRVLVCACVCECVCLFWPPIRWESACSVAGLLKNCKQVTQCSDPLQDRLCWRRSPPCLLTARWWRRSIWALTAPCHRLRPGTARSPTWRNWAPDAAMPWGKAPGHEMNAGPSRPHGKTGSDANKPRGFMT